MINISDYDFKQFVSGAIDAIPELYQEHLQNVAFIVEDEPTLAQRKKLKLEGSDLLFGLYEGTPLPDRSGQTKILPDKITVFKNALTTISQSLDELRNRVANTVWHEVAHYYGLDHKRIHELEANARKNLLGS